MSIISEKFDVCFIYLWTSVMCIHDMVIDIKIALSSRVYLWYLYLHLCIAQDIDYAYACTNWII